MSSTQNIKNSIEPLKDAWESIQHAEYLIGESIAWNNETQIIYILPFSNHENLPLMLIALVYAVLFMIGTCGNAAILAVVHHVKNGNTKVKHNTTLTYISILCIVDFLSMLPIPMTIIDQILGFWMFGTFACKLFRLLEHIGKFFSTFILVAFSVDRYMAVCHPLKTDLRKPSRVYTMLGASFTFACLLMSPILLCAHSKELMIHHKFDEHSNTLSILHLYKCVDDLDNEIFILFSTLSFIFAYAVPFVLLVHFYYTMLASLFKQSKMSMTLRGKRIDDKIPILRIAVYTLAICLFHFLCWTPYWCSVLHTLWREIMQKGEIYQPTSGFIYFMYLIHALPYFNSSCNFVLYGLLNRQLHQNNGGRRGHGTIVSGAPPTLKFTDAKGGDMNGGHSMCADSMAVRTPPSTPCRPIPIRPPHIDLSIDRTNSSAMIVTNEKSPLVACDSGEKNDIPMIPVSMNNRKPISEFKLDEGESVMI